MCTLYIVLVVEINDVVLTLLFGSLLDYNTNRSDIHYWIVLQFSCFFFLVVVGGGHSKHEFLKSVKLHLDTWKNVALWGKVQ